MSAEQKNGKPSTEMKELHLELENKTNKLKLQQK
jgi:hypothetical protein